MNVSDLISRAAKLCGSEAKLGDKAGFSQNAVWQAKRSGRVSAELAAGIHRATDGQVPKWKLRPDLWDAPQNEVAA